MHSRRIPRELQKSCDNPPVVQRGILEAGGPLWLQRKFRPPHPISHMGLPALILNPPALLTLFLLDSNTGDGCFLKQEEKLRGAGFSLRLDEWAEGDGCLPSVHHGCLPSIHQCAMPLQQWQRNRQLSAGAENRTVPLTAPS